MNYRNYRHLPANYRDGHMPTHDSIEWDREYSDAELESLHEDRRPQPTRPFAITAPAPGQGTGLVRRSARDDKWCPFCQTALNPTARAQSCARCRPQRERALDRARNQPAASVPSPGAQNLRDIQNLLDAIDEMSRVVGVASSMRYRNGGMKSEDAEDMLIACKDVMVASSPLRRRLRSRGDA